MSEAKRRILDTASDLFYEQGFHATGVDQVVEQADVAKMTLYNHFDSKDELIEGVLEQRHQEWMEWFHERLENRSEPDVPNLLTVFDVLEEWFKQEGFHGCAFINASAEYPDAGDPHKQQARRFKQRVQDVLEELVGETEARDPKGLARQIAFLVEGATVQAHIMDDPSYAQEAKQAARSLLNDHGINA